MAFLIDWWWWYPHYGVRQFVAGFSAEEEARCFSGLYKILGIEPNDTRQFSFADPIRRNVDSPFVIVYRKTPFYALCYPAGSCRRARCWAEIFPSAWGWIISGVHEVVVPSPGRRWAPFLFNHHSGVERKDWSMRKSGKVLRSFLFEYRSAGSW